MTRGPRLRRARTCLMRLEAQALKYTSSVMQTRMSTSGTIQRATSAISMNGDDPCSPSAATSFRRAVSARMTDEASDFGLDDLAGLEFVSRHVDVLLGASLFALARVAT